MTKVNILFVCLGNICRSPVAEGIFNEKVSQKQLQDFFYVDSCGTSQYHIGDPPDPRTAANALENGIKLNHQARQFEKADFRKFDYILVMDHSNMSNVHQLDQGNSFKGKVFLLRKWDDQDRGADVPDPYFSGIDGFQQVFDIVNRSLGNFLDELIEKYKLA